MGRKCTDYVKAEFHPRNFLLNHENPAKFVQLQCGYGKVYIMWRLFGVLLTVSLVSVSFYLTQFYATSTSVENMVKWPIFLTNWSLTMLLVNAITDSGVSIYTRIKRQDIITGECSMMPWYLKAAWVIHNVTHVAAISMTVLYWALLYKPGTTFEGYKILPFLTHAVNSIYSVSLLLVSGIPTRLLHFYHGIVFGIVYIVFMIIYHVAGGTNQKDEQFIYEILDWSSPSKATPIALGSIVLALVTHCLVFLIARLRDFVASKCCPIDVVQPSCKE